MDLHCKEPVWQVGGLGQILSAGKKMIESKMKPELDVVPRAYNHSTGEAKAGESLASTPPKPNGRRNK